MNYFVTAIGTDSGKTLVSAILCRALGYDYWKPVQSGDETDTNQLNRWFGDSIHTYKEAYCLKEPMSPHAAARIDRVVIDLDKIIPPKEDKLIIEGAGGLMVPLNDNELIADLIGKLGCKVVLVCDLYLGSINHSLLTINELKRRSIEVAGVIFNGPENKESQDFILKYSGYKCLLHIRREEEITPEIITRYAEELDLT